MQSSLVLPKQRFIVKTEKNFNTGAEEAQFTAMTIINGELPGQLLDKATIEPTKYTKSLKKLLIADLNLPHVLQNSNFRLEFLCSCIDSFIQDMNLFQQIYLGLNVAIENADDDVLQRYITTLLIIAEVLLKCSVGERVHRLYMRNRYPIQGSLSPYFS